MNTPVCSGEKRHSEGRVTVGIGLEATVVFEAEHEDSLD
jgi:hypothetical protein